MALAVPTMFLANIMDVQYWHMTNVLPAMPMNSLQTMSPALDWTNPMHAHGIALAIRITPMVKRAPNLSHIGPLTNLIATVPATEAMLEDQMSCVVSPSVAFTSGSKGAMANHMKKARKNPNQEQWNARMWGRLKLGGGASGERSE